MITKYIYVAYISRIVYTNRVCVTTHRETREARQQLQYMSTTHVNIVCLFCLIVCLFIDNNTHNNIVL